MHIKIRKWVKVTLLFIIIVMGFFLYSRYIGTKGVIVKEYAVVDSNLPENFYGLKIIQISDIHYKTTVNKNELKNIIIEINKLKPDIVIFSGDLFDSKVNYTNEDYKDLKNILSTINCNIGKYAIKGENDLKISSWDEIIEDSNFINLNDKSEEVYYNGYMPILLVGVSSNYTKNHIKEVVNENLPNESFSILVLHEPDFINDINYSNFNLILAGHSHNSQINLPIIRDIMKKDFSNKYYKPYYDLNSTKLYISGGIGTSKYKLRFLNKPSFNLYRLRNK